MAGLPSVSTVENGFVLILGVRAAQAEAKWLSMCWIILSLTSFIN